jgi:hypothetical protein
MTPPAVHGQNHHPHPSDGGPDHESRGVITVADRTGLEEAACECYGIIRGHFSRLLPGTYSRRFD